MELLALAVMTVDSILNFNDLQDFIDFSLDLWLDWALMTRAIFAE